MSKLYFPLRSSVEFFEQPSDVTAAARAKEGAILFDEVLFEDGQIVATLGEDMNWIMYRPRRELTEEDLTEALPPAGPRERMSIAIGVQSAVDQPATEMHPFGETVIRNNYAAQWHSAAIDELQALDVPWFSAGAPSEESLAKLSRPIGEAAAEFSERLRDGELNEFQIDFAAKALARDGIVAAGLGASINVTPMFAPMIEGSKVESERTGAAALSFLVPNVEHLPWEVIAEFRERAGSVEARGLLRGYEAVAVEQEAGDVDDFGNKMRQAVVDGLASALVDTEANVPKTVAREAVGLAVSLVPYVGPLTGAAAGIADSLGQRAEQRASGVFALIKLRESASEGRP